MNFSSLIHGAVGAIVCDSLLLHELALLSRVSSLGHKLVEYKYSHLKYLNLNDELMISKMTLENFSLMCHRLKGIEVLHLPDLSSIGGINGISNSTAHSDSVEADSTAVSTPAALSLSSTPTSTVNAAAPPDNDALIDLPPPTTASSSDSQNVDANPRLQYLFTLLDNNSTSLRVLSQPKITIQKANIIVRELIQEYLQHNLNQFTSLEVIAWGTGISEAKLFQEYVKKKKKKKTTTSGSDCDIKGEIFSLNTVDQYFQLNTREISEYIKFLPQLKTFFWVSKVGENDLNSEENSNNNSVSSISYFEVESGRSLLIPLWSNLLLLSIRCFWCRDGITNPTRVDLHLPHLLQLSLDSMDTINLVDVSFLCPELIALCYTCVCRIQPIQEKLNPKDGFLYEGHRYHTGRSLLSSIRSSPKLRNLNYNGVLAFLMDYSDLLTNEEKCKIEAKAKELGLMSPFDMPSEGPGPSRANVVKRANRIFSYALSFLPCASTLEMIEFAPHEMDLIEYCALFPNLRSISQISPWFFTPHWFRPHESEDESYYKYIHKRITKECEKRADRMYTPKDLNECLSVRDHEPVSVFNFCASGLELKLDTLKTLSSTSMFTQLKSIFLTSPVTIESSAVISLIFLTCQQLEHASLMQLDSINNTVFTSLPHDCIRPSLVTLRIKTPCDIHPDETFNDDLLNKCDLLPRLFPSLRHLEYLLMVSATEVSLKALECVPSAIGSLCDLLSDLGKPSDSDDNIVIVSDGDSKDDSDSAHHQGLSSSQLLLWPSLTTLIVRSCPNQMFQCESAEKRLAKIFSHRFAGGSSSQYLSPELTFINLSHETIDLHLDVESALCWNLSPRREVSRTSMQPESSLTIIQASESSYPERIPS